MHTLAGLPMRPVTVDDAPAIVDVLSAMEAAEPADEFYSAQDIVEELTSPGTDLARGSVAVLDGDRLVGYCVLQSMVPTDAVPTDAWRGYLFGGVHPDHGRRDIGGAMVDLLAQRAALLRDEHDPALPGELKIWVESARASTAALATSRGFETWRWFFRMQRDLTQPIAPAPVVTGFDLRPYASADEEAVRLARNEAFADHWGSTPTDPARWRAAFEATPSFRPEHSFVAPSPDGSIAGFVMVTEYQAETEQRGYRTGYVSLVGTARAARGRGLASAVLTRSLSSLADAGYARAELGVDADSPTGAGRIYQRLGFATIMRNSVAGRRF